MLIPRGLLFNTYEEYSIFGEKHSQTFISEHDDENRAESINFISKLYKVTKEQNFVSVLDGFIKEHIDSNYVFWNKVDATCNNEKVLVYTRDESMNEQMHNPGDIYLWNEGANVSNEFSDTSDIDLNTLLNIPSLAITSGRLDILKLCVTTGVDLQIFKFGLERKTLLHLAVTQENPNFDIINLLISLFDVNIQYSHSTALHQTVYSKMCEEDKLQILTLLTVAGADSSKSDFSFNVPLGSYVPSLTTNKESKIWRDIIDILTRKENSINIKDLFGKTALQELIAEFPPPIEEMPAELKGQYDTNHLFDVILYLISKGSDITTTDTYGDSIIHSAVGAIRIDLLRFLIRYGFPVNAISLVGFTPIYEISSRAEWTDEEEIHDTLFPILSELLTAGCNINTPSINGSTVVHFCCATLPPSVCEYMIQVGANLDAVDYIGRVPLHYAMRNKHVGVIDVIMKSYRSVNVQDIYNYAPIHYACLYGNNLALSQLLKHNPNVSAIGLHDIKPIHLAAENGDDVMIKLLISQGVDVNCLDQWNANPLHYAGYDGYPENSETLLAFGGNKTACDHLNQTPLNLALKKGQYKVALTLASDGDNVTYGDLKSFPNRPPIAEIEMAGYYENIAQEFRAIGNPESVVQSFFATRGLSSVRQDLPENRSIKQSVEDLVDDIVARIGEIDNRFQGQIVKSGSVYEGVKLGCPDEFDFMVNLCHFSKSVKNMNETIQGFASINAGNTMKEGISEFVTEFNTFNKLKIYNTYRKLFCQAVWDVQPKHKHFQGGYALVNEYKTSFSDVSIPQGKLAEYIVSYRGANYKILDISIDIHPVIYCPQWPDKALTQCHLIDNLSARGVYLIPKYNAQWQLPSKLNEFSMDNWRLSFSHVETEIFTNLPKALKEAFSLIKAFRLEPINPAVIQTPPPFKQISEDEDSDDSEMDSEVSINSKSSCDDPVDFHGFMNTNDEMEEGELEEMDDITMEKCISTYYVKQIFLQEVEKLCQSSKVSLEEMGSDRNIDLCVTLLWKVYVELQKCFHAKLLPSFFVPNQNLYYEYDVKEYNNFAEASRVRSLFVKHVVELLRKTGFGGTV